MLKKRIKEIIYAGLFAAVMIGLQVVLAPLPNIEVITLLIIIFTVNFGRTALYSIYVFVVLQGLIYGFGIWWISYLYIWTILYIAAFLLRKNTHAIFWALVGGAFGLVFGALTAIPYFFAGGIYAALAYIVAGIPFDIIHSVSNFVIILILFKPINHAVNKLMATDLSNVEGS